MTTTARNPRKPQTPSSQISTFDCMICMEENLPSSCGFMPGTNRHCEHCSSICRNCAASYISASVEQGKSLMHCPVPECQWVFDPISCRELVAGKIFDRWCDLLCESAVWYYDRCYCPNLDCRELIISECRASHPKEIRCPNCRESCCFRCSAPWDDQHKCDDVYVVIEINQWTRCPGCKYYVERIEGCSSIVCRCQTRFCYDCGEKLGSHYYCSCRMRRHRIRKIIMAALMIMFIAIMYTLVLFWPPQNNRT